MSNFRTYLRHNSIAYQIQCLESFAFIKQGRVSDSERA